MATVEVRTTMAVAVTATAEGTDKNQLKEEAKETAEVVAAAMVAAAMATAAMAMARVTAKAPATASWGQL